MRLNHRQAVAAMVGVTLLWSMAGVVSRHLEAARSFEVTFWRSGFNAAALGVALTAMRGRGLWRELARAPWPVWVSGLCWSVMFTAFMVALTLTSVANVLITMALGPLITALFARFALHYRLPLRTWLAIAGAGLGIAWMFVHELGGDGEAGDGLAGTLVALGVPIAEAVNWTVLQRTQHVSSARGSAAPMDMLPAVLIGALLSAAVALPLALPFQASPHDLGWLALLGVAQLAVPCLMAVALTRVLPGPEMALLALLEVIFGVTWAWLGAGEAPAADTLAGGVMVLAALAASEWLGLQERRAAA